MLGRFGADVVAAHNIAMNINGVLFMPAMALGMAATIRVGYRVGAGEVVEARSTAAVAMIATILVAVLGSILVYFLKIGRWMRPWPICRKLSGLVKLKQKMIHFYDLLPAQIEL